jgi:hypothetical protein
MYVNILPRLHLHMSYKHKTQIYANSSHSFKSQKMWLTPKGPKSIDGFLGGSGRLSRRQKHEWTYEILEEGGPM